MDSIEAKIEAKKVLHHLRNEVFALLEDLFFHFVLFFWLKILRTTKQVKTNSLSSRFKTRAALAATQSHGCGTILGTVSGNAC